MTEVKGSLKAKLKECKAKLVEAVAQCEREAEKARSLEKANTSFAETSSVERRRLDKMQERVRELEVREENLRRMEENLDQREIQLEEKRMILEIAIRINDFR